MSFRHIYFLIYSIHIVYTLHTLTLLSIFFILS